MTDMRKGPVGRDERDPAPPFRTPPTEAALSVLRDAVVDAGAVSAGLWFSYLLVLFYLLVGAAGVTQRDLLLSNIVTLPFLSGVQLPLQGFAELGPIIVVVVHAYLMLHLSLLATKVAAFQVAVAGITDPATQSQRREELPLNVFVQLFAGADEVQRGTLAVLLGLAATISLVIGPLALLVFFVIQFLPAHDVIVTWIQRGLVLLDLILMWLLGPAIMTRTRRWPHRRTLASTLALGAMVLVSIMAVQIVLAAATFRGEWLDTVVRQWPWRGPGWGRQRLWSDHIIVDHANLSGETRPGALVASLEGRNLERAVLTNTVMQQFDLTRANLRGATLKYAQLQGSNLNEALLDGASLTGAKLHGATLDHASLAGANLASAQLQGANLADADLQGADLDHAQLQGAILDGASLGGAILDGAQLQGASLNGTKLQGASLQTAFVWRSDPASAVMGDTRIGGLITEPRQVCEKPEGCEWKDPAADLKALIRLHVSDDDIDPIVKRLEAQLGPQDHDDRDAARERSWNLLQQAPQDGFERAQAFAWSVAGCATAAAPFVATQMTRTLKARSAQKGTALAVLAEQLLQPACDGARGVPAQTRADLVALRDHATPVATAGQDDGFD